MCRSCRALFLRKFVQGLAQVYRLDAFSAPIALQLWPATFRPAVQQKHWATVQQQNRGRHTSQHWGQGTDASVAAESEGRTEATPSTSSGETISSIPSVVGTEAPPTNKERVERDKTTKFAKEKGAGKSPFNPKVATNAQPKARWERKARAQKMSPAEAHSREANPEPRYLKEKWQSQKFAEPKEGWEGKARVQRIGPKPQRESWQIQKAALQEKFPDGWKPRKRLSPDALAGIRALNAQFPDVYTTKALADKFEVSPEAIRRILKSKWQASVEQETNRQDRWFQRGKQIWEQKAALGIKPPTRWRREGIARDPEYHEWSKRASQREREWEEEEIRKYKEYRERIKRQAAK